MTVKTDLDGSATITLADGASVRVPGLNDAPNVTAQDLRNVCTALLIARGSVQVQQKSIEDTGRRQREDPSFRSFLKREG